MKNEKIVEVCEIVVKVCNIAIFIAQAIIKAFPVKKSADELDQEEAKLIKAFMESELK